MKLQTRFLLSFLILVCAILVCPSDAQQSGRYIVTIQAPTEQAAEAVMRAGGSVIHVYDNIPAIAIQVPAQALAGLQRNPLIVDIEPDSIVSTMAKPPKQPPTPPAQTLPWGINRIDAEWAHAKDYLGQGAKVAVVDTGIDLTHPDLGVAGGINIINPAKSYADDNGHGTHVAGIIAARDNAIGVIGVAPAASLYAVKVLNRSGMGWTSDIMAGVDWCITEGMDVVNMSLGGGSYIQEFQNLCDAAAAAEVQIVAAAGNESGAVSYPAAYANVIGVSATDSSDAFASFSNFGIGVDIAAPGVSIYSTYKGGGYATLSGTSMAAPHVAGTLALSLNIFTTADDIELPAIQQGDGLVDAGEAATGIEDYGDDLP
mgnify:CR=1 FL=1